MDLLYKFTSRSGKKKKFDPETLKPFDMVLVRDVIIDYWTCGFFSHIVTFDDTKHLAGTKNDAPEFYKYWED